jgi:hypothetical protein
MDKIQGMAILIFVVIALIIYIGSDDNNNLTLT